MNYCIHIYFNIRAAGQLVMHVKSGQDFTLATHFSSTISVSPFPLSQYIHSHGWPKTQTVAGTQPGQLFISIEHQSICTNMIIQFSCLGSYTGLDEKTPVPSVHR